MTHREASQKRGPDQSASECDGMLRALERHRSGGEVIDVYRCDACGNLLSIQGGVLMADEGGIEPGWPDVPANRRGKLADQIARGD